MNATRTLTARSGFSMVEFLLAAFILGVGLLGLTALMAMNLRAAGGGRQRDTASYLANNALERLAADGRMSAILRLNGQTAFGANFLLANAVDDAANTYQEVDASNTARTTFDLEGRPSAANPVFTSVQWIRRAPKSLTPIASSASQTAEVVVNVSWSEAPATQGGTPVQKWLSFSRMIRY